MKLIYLYSIRMQEKIKRKKLAGTTINNQHNRTRISSSPSPSISPMRPTTTSRTPSSSRSSMSSRSSRSSMSSRSSRTPSSSRSSRSSRSSSSPRSRTSPHLNRQYSDYIYILHNNERNNVQQYANNFLVNLMLENRYVINTMHTLPNEITYGFRMFNNEPVLLLRNRHSGTLRNDYTFFRRI
jgi:hypothetical protein